VFSRGTLLDVRASSSTSASNCGRGVSGLDWCVPPGTRPYDVESDRYYFFNSATGESRWVDPRMSMEFSLMQRHELLCQCMDDQKYLLQSAPEASSRSLEPHRELPTSPIIPVLSPEYHPKEARQTTRPAAPLLPLSRRSIGFVPANSEAQASPGSRPLSLLKVAASPGSRSTPRGFPGFFFAEVGDETVRSTLSFCSACSTSSNQATLDGRFIDDWSGSPGHASSWNDNH